MKAPSGTIEVEKLTKSFRLYAEQYSSLKARALHLGRIPYQEFDAIRDVSFKVSPGKTLGLVGNNGSGKSTLLKCIAGTMQASSGQIIRAGSLAALLELGAGFHPELTGRENIFLAGSIMGYGRGAIESIFDEIVSFAELEDFIDNQVKHYSSGMYARLGFSLAASISPDILLVDEILAVGDEAFQQKSFNRIRKFREDGVTIIFVTHNTDLAISICDQLIALDHGQIIAEGNPEEVAEIYRTHLFGTDQGRTKTELRSASAHLSGIRFEVDGYPAKVIGPQDQVVLSMSVTSAPGLDDCVVAYAIRDSEGTLVNSSNSNVLAQGQPLIESNSLIEFTFNGLGLLSGNFTIDLGIHSHDGNQLYEQSPSAIRFTVLGDSNETGIVQMPVRCRVKSNSNQPKPPTT